MKMLRPSRPRYSSRRDANQAQIVSELRQIPGIKVWDIAMLGDGTVPGDILVNYRGKWFVFEVKTEEGRLTQMQVENRDIVPVVRTTADILLYL